MAPPGRPADSNFCWLLLHCTQIAMKELREKKIPFTIRRYLPDGRWVEWVGVSGLYCNPCILPSTTLPGVPSFTRCLCCAAWRCSYEDWTLKELIITEG